MSSQAHPTLPSLVCLPSAGGWKYLSELKENKFWSQQFVPIGASRMKCVYMVSVHGKCDEYKYSGWKKWTNSIKNNGRMDRWTSRVNPVCPLPLVAFIIKIFPYKWYVVFSTQCVIKRAKFQFTSTSSEAGDSRGKLYLFHDTIYIESKSTTFVTICEMLMNSGHLSIHHDNS